MSENTVSNTSHNGQHQRVALITTTHHYLSHSQHIGDRFIVGYPRHGQWHQPATNIVSMYVDQKSENDLSHARAKEFGIGIYPTIAEALRCGTDHLAVDAVLLIGEHGNYPRNEKGKILYPRFEFFEQIINVFEQDGRTAAVFNDKHLSYSFEKASKMVAASKRLGFPLLAGSSLPVTWRLPPLELPREVVINEALMVGVGSSDVSDYHALEAMQCMVERRRGGETGVKAVQWIGGPEVWRAGSAGRWSMTLLEAALARSDSRPGIGESDGRTQDLVRNGALPKLVSYPTAYLIEYRDGLRATLLMLNGATQDFTFAARLQGNPPIVSTQFLLPPRPNVAYSACLVAQIEAMFISGKPPYPAERTLLVSGLLESCLESKIKNQVRLTTPQLNVNYQAPPNSVFGDA